MGYCFICTNGNARARFQGKTNIVPTPSFFNLRFLRGIGLHNCFFIMATGTQEMVYESPKVEVIEVVVEQGFATSGSNDPWEEE